MNTTYWKLTLRQSLAATLVVGLAMRCGVARAAENWSRFRGPNGSGVAAEVRFPSSWTDDDYAWKVALPGKGHSCPVAWCDRVFVTTGNPETGELSLLALDAATGKTLWTRTFPCPPHSIHAANSYASSTPTVDDQRVYITWASPASLQAAALDHDGHELWRCDLGPVDYKHGFGGSPIVLDGKLIVVSDHTGASFVAALDAATGEPRWRRERGAGIESYATPAVLQSDAGGMQIVVCSSAEGIAALSPADGSVQWQLADMYPARCVNSPVAAGGLVLSGSGEGGNGKSLTAVRPPATPAEEATVAYELRKVLPQVPTPVALGDLLFTWSDRGVVSCYDLASGDAVWSERVGGNFFGSPVIAGDKLYCVAADGAVVTLAADREYKLLGRSELGEGSRATPAIHRGRMYLRTESSLACLPAE